MVTEQLTDEAERAAQEANEASIALMARADSFAIATPDEYQASGELLRTIKAKQKEVSSTRTGITKPMDDAKKRVMGLFKPVAERLDSAESTIKAAMLTFSRAEEERQRAEQVERDRLAEIERKRLEARSNTARDKGDEPKAAVLEEAATQVAAPPPPPPTKAAGVHTVTTWSAELTDKMELIKAAATNPSLAPYLSVDMTKLNSLARNLKAEMDIPGIRAVSTTNVSARAR